MKVRITSDSPAVMAEIEGSAEEVTEVLGKLLLPVPRVVVTVFAGADDRPTPPPAAPSVRIG